MNSDLQIQISNNQQLTVHSPITLFPLPALLTLALLTLILALVYFANRSSAPRAQNAYLAGLWLFSILLIFLFGIWSHTVTFTRAADDIHIVDKFAGITYSDRHYPLDVLRQAIIQTARSGPRIGLLMQNGVVVYPLGKAYNPKPSLDLVILKMNDFINAGPNGGRSDRTPSHLDLLKREIEENQQLNRQAAQKAAQPQ